MNFYQQVMDVSHTRETKGEVIAYFKETYPEIKYNKKWLEIA